VTRPLVIGLGRADRGDDGIGLEVARLCAHRFGAAVEVVLSEQPADLMEAWAGRERVVVVDAVRSGARQGTIHVVDLGAEPASSGEGRPRPAAQGGTHALGLDEVVGLARVLGSLPRQLLLVGVEVSSFEYGSALSPAVADAVEATVAEVMAQVVDRSSWSP
jgi:hydrogenase maturation protease